MLERNSFLDLEARQRIQRVGETNFSVAKGRTTSSETSQRLDVIVTAQFSAEGDVKASGGRFVFRQVVPGLFVEEG